MAVAGELEKVKFRTLFLRWLELEGRVYENHRGTGQEEERERKYYEVCVSALHFILVTLAW